MARKGNQNAPVPQIAASFLKILQDHKGLFENTSVLKSENVGNGPEILQKLSELEKRLLTRDVGTDTLPKSSQPSTQTNLLDDVVASSLAQIVQKMESGLTQPSSIFNGIGASSSGKSPLDLEDSVYSEKETKVLPQLTPQSNIVPFDSNSFSSFNSNNSNTPWPPNNNPTNNNSGADEPPDMAEEVDCCWESYDVLRGIWERAGSIDLKMNGLGGGTTPKATPTPREPKGTQWDNVAASLLRAADGMMMANNPAQAAARGLSSAGSAATSLGFGSLGQGLNIGSVFTDSIDKLKNWTDHLAQSNYQFAQFSAGMKAVEVQAKINEIMLGRQTGDRRAVNAEKIMKVKALQDAKYAEWGNKWNDFQAELTMTLNDKSPMSPIRTGLGALLGGKETAQEAQRLKSETRKSLDLDHEILQRRYRMSLEERLGKKGAEQYLKHGRPQRFGEK